MRAGGAGAGVLPVLAASMAVFRSCSHLAFSSWVLRAGLRFRCWAGPPPAMGKGVGGPAPPPGILCCRSRGLAGAADGPA